MPPSAVMQIGRPADSLLPAAVGHIVHHRATVSLNWCLSFPCLLQMQRIVRLRPSAALVTSIAML